jgi:hypothetical protein
MTSMKREDRRVVRTGSILLLLILSVAVAFSIAQPALGALGWIAIVFFAMAGALSLFAMIRSVRKP